MKIRMQGNSIRYRMNRREVEEFAATRRFESSVQFPSGTLRYAVECARDAGAPEARFGAEGIVIVLPEHMAADWATGQGVSIAASQPLPGGGTLEILVEKDFQCLHKGDEAKDPNAFPNPDALSA